mmetsp:Transcript_19243/g.32202  ORF Transcript_19243/g.32202 Transcript_19243/m.32202 type:complete len:178 (-) Transcript_19243:249-782(-)
MDIFTRTGNASPGMCKAFVDDGNLGAPFDLMVEAIQLILSEGPQYGYHLNLRKGTYVLAKCTTDAEAFRRRDVLLGLGIAPNVIRIHPDNLHPSAAGTESKSNSDALHDRDSLYLHCSLTTLTPFKTTASITGQWFLAVLLERTNSCPTDCVPRRWNFDAYAIVLLGFLTIKSATSF